MLIIGDMTKLAEHYHTLCGESIAPQVLKLFAQYQSELLAWNQKFNLTAIRTPEEIESKHFMDALSLLPTLQNFRVSSLIDVGTGAGFPGIPLKIVQPDLHLVLVESVEKKTGFCRHIVSTLELANVEVLTERAEAVGQNRQYREQFDCAVARAVAALPILLEYLLPLVRVGGIVIAQKGASAGQEMEQAKNACAILGGGNMHSERVYIPGLDDERYLIVVEKVRNTPPQYPRRIGLPARKSL